MGSQVGWKADAISAVEELLTLTPGSSTSSRWKPIGQAVAGSEPGWLVIDKRGEPIKPDTLNELCFAANGGPDVQTAYPIETFRSVDGVLMVKEPPALPSDSRLVWTKTTSLRMLTEKLLSGLREAGTTPIADALAAKRLSSGFARGVTPPPGLLGNQPDAYRACLSPGVRLVWGPPGAGKTKVLARAIEDLVGQGKRILLVSTANIAVDNALYAVVKAMRPRRGTVLRIGPPQLAEVANNPDVQLQHLAAAASIDVDNDRAAVEAEITELDTIDARVTELAERVGDFSPARYRDAAQRVENERRFAALAPEVLAAEENAANARAAGITTNNLLAAARQAVDSVAPAREAQKQLAELTVQLNNVTVERTRRQQALTAAERALAGASGWLAAPKAKRAWKKAEADLTNFDDTAGQHRHQLTEMIAELRPIADAADRTDIARLDGELARARHAAEQVAHDTAKAERMSRDLRGQQQALRSAGLPTPDDRALVARCTTSGLPAAFEQLQSLRVRQRGAATRRVALANRRRELVDRSRALRTDAEKALVDEAKVVATTLARSRLHRALTSATFDVVLVDEAGAASLVEVMLALCRATRTAVLFGDFLQLAPVQDGSITRSSHAALRRWVLPSPFDHAGIRTPTEAIDNPGCVPLLHQFRFGANLRQLANDVIYQVLRDAAELPGMPAHADTEIVFIDTSGMGELAAVRRPGGKRGWWPAGVLLARALAECHLPDDGEVGVVTPYGAARDTILAGLRDRDLVAGVAVGTVHAFQGREFPTVIFDLVEDGQGWIAQARSDGSSFANEGVRLFGVGITRAQHRLYLIGDRGAVATAARGPLGAVRAAGLAQRLQIWSGAELLGLVPTTRAVDSVFADVSEMLRQLVTVSDITDEHSFYAELERALALASSRVWMWSPWISTRAEQVVPLIEAAVARGVDVRVFLRPDDDRNMAREWAQRQLPALRSSGVTVIRSDHEHRKIVVIDERLVLFGSLNALSNSSRSPTRESMLTLEGREFARRLLAELRAPQLGTPHPCGACGTVCEVRRPGGRQPKWSWHCPSCRNSELVPEPSGS